MAYQRRLTDRVLANWDAITEGMRLPRLSEITENAFGTDWPNCAVIQLDPVFTRSRFVYLGEEVPAEKSKAYACVLADFGEGTLLRSVANQVSAMVCHAFPMTLDGAWPIENQVRLYRSIALPISEDNKAVDHVLIAISHRDVPLEKRSAGKPVDAGWMSSEIVELTSDALHTLLL